MIYSWDYFKKGMKNMKKLETLTFKKFCMTIGNLPSSYIDSLSYYECLLWLIKYLKEEVIPTVNNNSEAVQELQNLFTQLQEFIQNYFDDLDVQEEINNKLDEMVSDGTMESIINQEIFGSLNTNVNNNTSNIVELQNKQAETDQSINNINNVNIEQSTNITALQQAQTSNVKKHETDSITLDMLSSEVLNAMTGGSTPVVGANSVGTSELKDGGITIYKLDEKLKSLYSLNFTQLTKPENKYAGFYQISNDVLIYVNDAPHLQCYQVPLTKGKTYRFSGYNYSSAKGIFIGTAIGSAAITYSPDGTELDTESYNITADTYSTELIFQCNQDGLIAFINEFANLSDITKPSLVNLAGGLFELSSIEVFSKELPRTSLKTLNPYLTINNYILQLNNNPYALRSLQDGSIECYLFKKGHKYKVTGKQRYLIAGFTLFDEQFYLSYISATEESASLTSYEYEFTATGDFIGCITKYGSITGTVKEYDISDPNNGNRLDGIKILYNGDSITESRTNTSAVSYNGGAYPYLISELTNSTYTNYSHGGATITSGNDSYHRIVNDVVNMDSEADVVVFSGGINDYWQNKPLGTFDEDDYTGSLDINTFTGALEKIFRDSLVKWLGKPILFVITHKIYGTAFTANSAGYTFEELHDRIVAVCNKYSIPYYDCFKDGILNSYISAMNTEFMTAGSSGEPDYTHPNRSAYLKYYVPQVIDLIETNLPYNI